MRGATMSEETISLLDDRFEYINPPQKYKELWNDINLPIQTQKAAHYSLPEKEKTIVLNKLSKRAYYLTEVARRFGAKNIAEVGTAEGWQFYSFAEYCTEVDGRVWSCDVADKHSKKHYEEYGSVANFVHGDSQKLAKKLGEENVKIDLFYIDGSHEKGAVLKDVGILKKFQTTNQIPVWIFDDFDDRFGCYHDISLIARAAPQYYVYSPGKTASNNPTHQLIVRGYFK
jgi:hypothetical protein